MFQTIAFLPQTVFVSCFTGSHSCCSHVFVRLCSNRYISNEHVSMFIKTYLFSKHTHVFDMCFCKRTTVCYICVSGLEKHESAPEKHETSIGKRYSFSKHIRNTLENIRKICVPKSSPSGLATQYLMMCARQNVICQHTGGFGLRVLVFFMYQSTESASVCDMTPSSSLAQTRTQASGATCVCGDHEVQRSKLTGMDLSLACR